MVEIESQENINDFHKLWAAFCSVGIVCNPDQLLTPFSCSRVCILPVHLSLNFSVINNSASSDHLNLSKLRHVGIISFISHGFWLQSTVIKLWAIFTKPNLCCWNVMRIYSGRVGEVTH